MEEDTIVAIATPPGRAGLGVVRLSGPASIDIATRLAGWRETPPERRATVAILHDQAGHPLDEAVITLFCSPRSFTGEDMAEFSCHGSPLILDCVVCECLARNARGARPGEFTLRAFLNGRIDLAQAEAVVDLVEAKSEAGLGLALRQMQGELGQKVEPIRAALLSLLAHITALVEFSEEDIPTIARSEVIQPLNGAEDALNALLRNARQGEVLQHGTSLAIAGPPNAGKSSILNGLLGRARSIVTPIAGTTRDTIEEQLVVGGVFFRIIDTAGMTETDDLIEAIGVERSRAAVESSDVILFVADASRSLTDADRDLFALLRQRLHNGPTGATSSQIRAVVALNKSDLPPRMTVEDVRESLPNTPIVHTSAVESGGLAALRDALPKIALGGPLQEGFVLSSHRHIQSVTAARDAIHDALEAREAGLPLDLVSLDVRRAVDRLGEVLGLGVADDVLDEVFSRFCIGK